jgi:hypothetical protein
MLIFQCGACDENICISNFSFSKHVHINSSTKNKDTRNKETPKKPQFQGSKPQLFQTGQGRRLFFFTLSLQGDLHGMFLLNSHQSTDRHLFIYKYMYTCTNIYPFKNT